VVEIARRQLQDGQRKVYVVAPPGSGKTVLGLFLWAECVRVPALVLSPNSAIQAQWAKRLDLFDHSDATRAVVSTDNESPALLTSLTYQSVTLPSRGGKDIDADALNRWIERLVDEGHAQDPDEAKIWIDDLKRHNHAYYVDRLSGYRKAIRDDIAISGGAMKTLHASALATLERLKTADVGLLILDECHHLLNHWGRVLADAHRYFDNPIVIGLTATPPDVREKPTEDVERYRKFFGPVDYEVPVPAVVKDGFLSPYRDLIQFVRPTVEELEYVANADQELYKLVEELCKTPTPETHVTVDSSAPVVESLDESGDDEQSPTQEKKVPRESMTDWLVRVLSERRLAVGTANDWAAFERRDPALAWAGPKFLEARGTALPKGVPTRGTQDFVSRLGKRDATRAVSELPPMMVLVPILDRYIRRRLRVSSEAADRELSERAISRLRMLGIQITETGSQACASPIGRIMAYARGKAEAMVPILKAECRALGKNIRAVVVTDFEKTSAVASELSHLLDKEAGGAVAAFRVLLKDVETDALNPVLITGSTVLIDDDLKPLFRDAADHWLSERGLDVELDFGEQSGFHVVSAHGGDWCPRVYVALVTELFQRGVTRCLVGTRGLLGEGWDASKINVLIDLTTVTTSTSVNQLRGRSLRLDPDDPMKLAHNWDVVCIAPVFVKGLDDYHRFIDKHNTLFGLTDDGVIEKGVGLVHAAFTEIEPELIEGSMNVLNAEMLQRPTLRAEFRELWRIGEPFHSEPVHTVELLPTSSDSASPPPYAKATAEWTTKSLTQSIGLAVLGALREAGLIADSGDVRVEQRSGGYVRAFLKSANEKDSRLFSESLEEALGPLDRPRYVIRRYVDYRLDTWLSRIMPKIIGRYFRKKLSRMEMLHAVPSALAKNKLLAAIYGRHWNAHVSPTQPIYARSDEGERLLELATSEGVVSKTQMHRKEVFL